MDFFMQKIKRKNFSEKFIGAFYFNHFITFDCLTNRCLFFEHHWYLVSRRLANDITGEVSTLVYVLEEYPDSEETDELLKQMEDNLMFDISFEKGQILSENAQPSGGSSIVKQVKKALSRRGYSYQIQENLEQDHILAYIQLNSGVLEVRVPVIGL